MTALLLTVLLASSPAPRGDQNGTGQHDAAGNEGLPMPPAMSDHIHDGVVKTRPHAATAVPAQGDAKPKEAAVPPSLDGYQQTTWGMTRKQVQAKVRGLKDVDGILGRETVVAGLDVAVGYHFTNNKLDRVVIVPAKRTQKGMTQEEQYSALAAALEQKYGQAEERATRLGEALQWSNATTTIALTYDALRGVALQYQSRALEDEVESVDTGGL